MPSNGSNTFVQTSITVTHISINKSNSRTLNIKNNNHSKNTHNRYELSWVYILNLLGGMFNQLVPLTPRTCYGTKILYNSKVSNTSFKIMGIIERFLKVLKKQEFLLTKLKRNTELNLLNLNFHN